MGCSLITAYVNPTWMPRWSPTNDPLRLGTKANSFLGRSIWGGMEPLRFLWFSFLWLIQTWEFYRSLLCHVRTGFKIPEKSLRFILPFAPANVQDTTWIQHYGDLWIPKNIWIYMYIYIYIQLYIPYWILYKDTVDMSYPYSSASPQTFFATPSQRPSFFGFCNACKLWECGRFFVSLAAEISERRILIAPGKKHRPQKTNMDTQHECLESR